MSPEIKDLYDEYAARRDGPPRIPGESWPRSPAGRPPRPFCSRPSKRAEPRTPSSSPKDDPRLETGYIEYPIEGGKMRAYSARPKGAGKLSGVIVIHENRGLNPHTEDVARRVALEGYLAIAPDALSPLGGTPAESRRGPAPLPEARPRGEHQELRRRRRLPQDGAPGDGQGRLHGLLLGRGGDEPGGRQRARPRGGRPLLRQPARAARTSRRSRRPCSSTTPGTTSASTPASRPSRRPSKRPASNTRSTCTRAPGTPS